jgi:hypothetical protein
MLLLGIQRVVEFELSCSIKGTYNHHVANRFVFTVRVTCPTPYAARGICADYKKMARVSPEAKLHYEFKDFGNYGDVHLYLHYVIYH